MKLEELNEYKKLLDSVKEENLNNIMQHHYFQSNVLKDVEYWKVGGVAMDIVEHRYKFNLNGEVIEGCLSVSNGIKEEMAHVRNGRGEAISIPKKLIDNISHEVASIVFKIILTE